MVHLGQVRNRYEKIAALGAEFVTVSNDPLEKLAAHIAKREVPFPMLSDTAGAVIKLYDLKNNWELFHHGVPHPATFKVHEKWVPGDPELHCDFIFVSENLKSRVRPVTVDAQLQASDHQPIVLTLG